MSRLPPWAGWLWTRVVSGVVSALALSLIVFVATQALPSDPARVILGPEATEQSVAILSRQLGLDRPMSEQYWRWLSSAVQGDFGLSMSSRRPVLELISGRIAATTGLLACVMTVSVVLSVLIGVALAVRRGSRVDRVAVSTLMSVKAVPVFATGIGLVLLFSTSVFSWLPAVSLIDGNRSMFSQLEFLVLPCATLVVSAVPYLARLLRGSMIEALDSEYVQQARLRGIPERRVRYLHALPNAIIPLIQGTALVSSVLIGGAIVVEVLFNYPGLGSLLNQAVETRDLPIVQALVLVVAAGVVSLNLVADLLSVLLTPKLRTRAPSEAQASKRASAFAAGLAREPSRETAPTGSP